MPPSKLEPVLNDVRRLIERDGVLESKVAQIYGVGETTVRRFVVKHGLKRKAAVVTAKPLAAEVSREEKLEQEVKELRRRANVKRQSHVAEERVLEEIRQAVNAVAPSFTPAAEAEQIEGLGRHTQALLLSDLHAGEVVESEAVNGLNEFNWEILEHRMERVHRSLLSYQAHRPYPIDELQVWMLGDMCSGSNHLELMETNELSAAEQGYKVGILLGRWLERLVPHYARLHVVGVAGNHPRVQAKPASKNVFNNFDWMAYKVAQTYLRNYDSISWAVPRAGAVVQEIAGLDILVFHGDGIRSTMPGVPWGGVMRRVNELKKQYMERGIKLDGFALGHFHQANVVQSSVFMNGSLKGTDEYSLKQFGGGEKPTQLLLTFDEDKRRLTDASYITP